MTESIFLFGLSLIKDFHKFEISEENLILERVSWI